MDSKNSEVVVVQVPAAESAAAAAAETNTEQLTSSVPLLKEVSSHLQQQSSTQLPEEEAAAAAPMNTDPTKPKKFSEMSLGEKVFLLVNILAFLVAAGSCVVRTIKLVKTGAELHHLLVSLFVDTDVYELAVVSLIVTALALAIHLQRVVWLVVHTQLVVTFIVVLLLLQRNYLMMYLALGYLVPLLIYHRRALSEALDMKRRLVS